MDLEEIKDKYHAAHEYYSTEYERAKEDIEFLHGDQWDEKDIALRQKEGRPCLTENRLLPFVHQVVNDIRQTRPAIRVSPVDDNADIDTAEVFKGIVKNIEVQSDAYTAYDTAAQTAVSGGYGFILIRTDYCDETTFDQDILIERVLNPFSVYLDPNHQKMDGADAEYGFIFEDMDKEAFEAKWPDENVESFEDSDDSWHSEHTVRVAECFYKSYKDDTLYLIDGQAFTGTEIKALKEIQGIVIDTEGAESRKIRTPSIKWCKLTANNILEETEWVGKYIPIVPVYGEEVYIEGRRESHSLIRQAIDPQKMYNYWITTSTEVIAMQPKAPFVGAVGQFETHGDRWANANVENISYLEYDQVDHDGQLAPPPQRQAPIMGSPAMLQETMRAADGIKSSLGIFDANLGSQGNEISGIALQNRQMRGDNATFHFVDNLATSIRQVGNILIDLIPKLYRGERIVRIIGEDGEEENVKINAPFEAENGEIKEFNLGDGKYDVVVDVGPSYATKRQETVDFITTIAKAEPRVLEVAGDLLFKSMDGPYSQEIADRIKSTMDPSLLGDDPMAAKLQAGAQMIQKLQKDMEMMDAALQDKKANEETDRMVEIKKLENDKAETQIKAAKAQAEIEKIYAEMGKDNELSSKVADVMAAVEMILDHEESKTVQ